MDDWTAADADEAAQRGIWDGVHGNKYNPPTNYREEYAWGYDFGKNKDKKPEKTRGCAVALAVLGAGLATATYTVHLLMIAT